MCIIKYEFLCCNLVTSPRKNHSHTMLLANTILQQFDTKFKFCRLQIGEKHFPSLFQYKFVYFMFSYLSLNLNNIHLTNYIKLLNISRNMKVNYRQANKLYKILDRTVLVFAKTSSVHPILTTI